MDTKEYIEQRKEIYNNAEEWANAMREDYFFSIKNQDVQITDENYIKDLVFCTTWEDAEDIVIKYKI